MLTLYTKEDEQITFCGLKPEGERLKIYDLVRNHYQQLCYEQVSADSIPSYDREFYVSALQYQEIWDQEDREQGVTS